MITRKNLLTMGVTMFVLLFLFQFSQIMKESGNEYDVNNYATDASLDGKDAWQKSSPKEVLKKGGYVLYVKWEERYREDCLLVVYIYEAGAGGLPECGGLSEGCLAEGGSASSGIVLCQRKKGNRDIDGDGSEGRQSGFL